VNSQPDLPQPPSEPERSGVTPPHDEVLTIREVADFLKLSDQHVRRLAEAGVLPGRKLGDRWRFSRVALLRHLEGDPS